MKNEMLTIFAVAACVAATGCRTMYSGFGAYGQEEREQRDQVRIREQMERIQLQRDAGSALSAARDAESRLAQLDMRLERLEAASRSAASYASLADIDALRRENDALRAEIADMKAAQERMRGEIVSNVQSLIKEQQKRAAETAKTTVAKSQSGYEHKVEPGQTLSAIAKAYGVTVKAIRDANGLPNDTIRVGQVLFIPD